MKAIYLINHLGLGDQLIMCGMVRHFVENGYKVKICTRLQHKDTCEFLYRDTDRVEFDFVTSDAPSHIHERMRLALSENYEVRPLATYKIPENMWNWATIGPGVDMCNWTHATYLSGNVNPLYLKTKFKVIRDLEREQKVFERFNLKKNEYIFVHESNDRSRRIHYTTDLPVFNPDDHYKEFPVLFDYLTIIENAKEVHCMTSSYSWLVELTEVGDPTKNFLHTLDIPNYFTIRESYLTYSDSVWTFVQGPSTRGDL